ncbi:protein DMP9-like [Nymphaea colorata]|nr:protein DMP9-like [Nymphaea colorata]
MDETSGIAVSVYDSPAQEEAECTASPAPVTAKSRGRKKQVVAKRMQKTFASTSMLANFLPTGTLLTFEMLLPAVSRDGLCTPVAVTMTHSLLLLCSFSCFLFHFTDSFRGSDGKLYYGFVTPSGLALFRSGIPVEVPKDDRFRVGFVDFLHAIMSVTVFLAIAFSDHRVVDCLLPGRQPEMRELMEGIPVIVGAVCSTFFFMFPNTRYGIGCMPA